MIPPTSCPQKKSPWHAFALFVVLTFFSCCGTLLHAEESLQAGEKVSLFNGRDLEGWTGNRDLWSVRDGQIVGTTIGHHLESKYISHLARRRVR